MKKIWFFYLILVFTQSFAQNAQWDQSFTNWDQYFKEQKVVDFDFGDGKILNLTIPNNFKYVYSKKTDEALFFEFIPEGESLETWTQMYSIIIYPQPVEDFQNYVRKNSGPFCPFYDSLTFFSDDQVEAYYYFWQTHARAVPEYEKLLSLDEITSKIGMQGQNVFCAFSFSFRVDRNEFVEQRLKRIDDLVNLMEDSYEISYR